MSTYEEQRLEQIAKNKALFNKFNLENASQDLTGIKTKPKRKWERSKPPSQRRTSSRIASSAYALEEKTNERGAKRIKKSRKLSTKKQPLAMPQASVEDAQEVRKEQHLEDMEELRKKWASWDIVENEPTRGENGTFHFDSHPDFTPNKSPAEVMKEGSFGGTYFRPLYSKYLGITVQGDWEELPQGWIQDLNVEKYLISSVYDAEVNKFGVTAGQTIEQWEDNGWIVHTYDVRGWFQWYCRFFQGRRCDDDERQIGRWKNCVGETGRWKNTLLKKYVAAGIRSVADDGDDEIEGVSPVIHQTCHHWAYEVRQDALDAFWNRQN